MSNSTSSFRSVLQLMRFPAVFTSLADIFLGAALVAVAGREWNILIPGWHLVMLVVASASLYLSGMVFNDVFDVEQDRRERPQRPIPSGRVTRTQAVLIGTLLMIVGVGVATSVGLRSGLIASFLSLFILLYDGVVKKTPIAPLFMGACRTLNVLLGASLAVGAPDAGVLGTPWQVLYVALGTGGYIVGVTMFARQEAGQPSASRLGIALAVIDAAFVGLAAAILTGRVQTALPDRPAAFLLVIVAFVVNRRALGVMADPKPATVQATVRLMLLSIIMLDAALIYATTAHVPLAVATALLILPAVWIGKWLYMT